MIEIRQAGPFANDGERRVVDAFRRCLPPSAILLTNLFLPDRQDTLEIDLVAVTPLGIFVIEIKDWHGDLHFERGVCIHRGVPRDDPRNSISMKAKKVHGLLKHERPITGVDLATNPLLVLANTDATLSGNLNESVPVRLYPEAALAVAAGRVGSHRQNSPMTLAEIRTVADMLHDRHLAEHQRQIGAYRLGDQINSPFEEYMAVEVNDPTHRVRLKRHAVDPLISSRERDEQRVIASRHVVALRQLQHLHSRVIPLVYACFDDPNDDGSIWTAYEAIEGIPLVEVVAKPQEKLAMVSLVAEALHACHNAGVLHRALTSDCILLPHGQHTPVVLHFDFARVRGKETIAAGPIRKSLRELLYAAPEVRQDPSSVSPASDVFSVAVCAVEALEGRNFDSPEVLTEALRDVRPRQLKAFLSRMIEDAPGRRPTMQQVTDTFRSMSK